MADSIRKMIFQDLEAVISAVPSIAHCGFGSFELLKVSRPAVGILPDDELTDKEPDDNLVEKLRVTIRVVVDEAAEDAGYELEDILADIHAAVMADPTRGGIADDTIKVGTKWLFLDQQYPRAGADLNLLIQYQTEETDPAVQSGIGPGVS